MQIADFFTAMLVVDRRRFPRSQVVLGNALAREVVLRITSACRCQEVGSRWRTAFRIFLVPPKKPPQPNQLPSAKKAFLPSQYIILTQLLTKSLPCLPYEIALISAIRTFSLLPRNSRESLLTTKDPTSRHARKFKSRQRFSSGRYQTLLKTLFAI